MCGRRWFGMLADGSQCGQVLNNRHVKNPKQYWDPINRPTYRTQPVWSVNNPTNFLRTPPPAPRRRGTPSQRIVVSVCVRAVAAFVGCLSLLCCVSGCGGAGFRDSTAGLEITRHARNPPLPGRRIPERTLSRALHKEHMYLGESWVCLPGSHHGQASGSSRARTSSCRAPADLPAGPTRGRSRNPRNPPLAPSRRCPHGAERHCLSPCRRRWR